MIFLLLVSLLLLTVYEYYFKVRYLLHPAMVVLLVFDFSVLVAAANYSKLGDIQADTVKVIIMGLLAFIFGANVTNMVSIKRYSKKSSLYEKGNQLVELFISENLTIILIAFELIITILCFMEIKSMAGSGVMGFFSVISSARSAIYSGALISHSMLVQQGIYFCRAVTYVYIFYMYYNLIMHGIKPKIKEFIIPLLYFVQALLSTGRTEIIYIIYAILIIQYSITITKKRGAYFTDRRFIKKLVIVLILFVVLGNIRNSGKRDIFQIISVYVGSSIYALDKYIIGSGMNSNATFWGQETQPLYYSIMRAFGKDTHSTVATLSPIIIDVNVMTNVYTAFRRYIHDFGIAGLLIINVLLGCFFSLLFKHWINNPLNKAEVDRFYSELRIVFWKVAPYHEINPKEWV